MKLLPQPLDRAAVILMAVLALLIALVLWAGDHTVPKVRDFNWQDKQVGADNTAFILTFNRAMDWSNMAQHLKTTPDLPGKLSWSGRRLAYTLKAPIPYGQAFQIQLADVTEADRGPRHQPKLLQPWSSQFRSRDRAFVYLGVNSKESGRLILYNFTQDQKTILTPADLVVMDFKPYPWGDRILFSARDRQSPNQSDSTQLYTVTTGLQISPPDAEPTPKTVAGEIERVLNDQSYQILKYDLAADGSRIVVQRALRQGQGLGAVSLWQVLADGTLQLLQGVEGGDFLIAPDSRTLVIAQGQGLALLPLEEKQNSDPLDFLPQFGMVLSFAQDGSAATMVKFNSDYTRSLFLVTNQGTQTELLKTKGSILSTRFDPKGTSLYCLLTRLKAGTEEYIEEPYLVKIDLKTGKQTKLLDLSDQLDVSISLAPDGSALLFDQIISADQAGDFNAPVPNQEGLLTAQGTAITTSKLWMLPLNSNQSSKSVTGAVAIESDKVTSGLAPKWLP